MFKILALNLIINYVVCRVKLGKSKKYIIYQNKNRRENWRF